MSARHDARVEELYKISLCQPGDQLAVWYQDEDAGILTWKINDMACHPRQ